MGVKTSPSKENILKKIRQALSDSTPLPFPQSEGNQPQIFPASPQELEVLFAEQFSKLQGKFSYCGSLDEFKEQFRQLRYQSSWHHVYFRKEDSRLMDIMKQMGPGQLPYEDLATCDVSVTFCESLVARTGTMVLSSRESGGRTPSVYAPVHVCIAFTSQVVYDIRDALQLIKKKYGTQLPSLISFATGPSRTADIEKTLVVGVHGPKEVYCFLVED
jgi:L-lactate dehydrogenase complex protein LldG